ncbi:chemotaxis protein CheX [Paenibacillus sp. GCM10012307]|uniref:Chemotaxis protein CheX n=1 Tax=Paenibacillus roseus TaxID=2798579 RepID=A0A934J4R7_9BACL|nr:chemotaxis protein CheX [Paenibacillus roseus]MBJ6362850.1 chemotaxis protein CheX [Paenibacillus roseus]
MALSLEYYKAVSRVGSNVLSGYLGMTVSTMELREQVKLEAEQDIAVKIEMLGQLDGRIICTMNEETAKQIVGRMFGGMEIQHLDEMGWSAIKEFGNWFVSGIATEFSNQGIEVNISHPSIEQNDIAGEYSDHFVVTPLESEYGIIDIYSKLVIKSA